MSKDLELQCRPTSRSYFDFNRQFGHVATAL